METYTPVVEVDLMEIDPSELPVGCCECCGDDIYLPRNKKTGAVRGRSLCDECDNTIRNYQMTKNKDQTAKYSPKLLLFSDIKHTIDDIREKVIHRKVLQPFAYSVREKPVYVVRSSDVLGYLDEIQKRLEKSLRDCYTNE